MSSTRFRIDAAHPALPGHFPGRPVVPGVVLLDRVIAVIEREFGARIAALPQVKFLKPLLPEQDAELRIEKNDGKTHFRIFVDGETAASGIVETEARA